MLMGNRILRLLNHLYLKSNRVNQLNVLHAEIVWREIKVAWKMCKLVMPEKGSRQIKL